MHLDWEQWPSDGLCDFLKYAGTWFNNNFTEALLASNGVLPLSGRHMTQRDGKLESIEINLQRPDFNSRMLGDMRKAFLSYMEHARKDTLNVSEGFLKVAPDTGRLVDGKVVPVQGRPWLAIRIMQPEMWDLLLNMMPDPPVCTDEACPLVKHYAGLDWGRPGWEGALDLLFIAPPKHPLPLDYMTEEEGRVNHLSLKQILDDKDIPDQEKLCTIQQMIAVGEYHEGLRAMSATEESLRDYTRLGRRETEPADT